MIGVTPGPSGGMGDAVARVEAIQARISSMVGARLGAAAVPVFELPASAETPTASAGSVALREPETPAPAARTDAAPAPEVAASDAARSPEPVTPVADPPTGAAPGGGPTATPGPWAAKLSEQGQRWAPAIQAAADEAGIDASLLAALVRHESNFDPAVTSHAGAIGLAQLMPGTAAGLGVDPHDPYENLAGGARYLRAQLDRFGDPKLALAAYNAGPNRVAQAGGVPRIPETLAYVDRVIATWEQLR